MAKLIEAIEGIGPTHGEKLHKAGCGTPAKLLRDGTMAKGQKAVCAASGLSHLVVLHCINVADLFRVKRVMTQ